MADMLKYAIGNAASTTLSVAASNSDTSMTITSDTNFAAKSGEGMVIIDESQATEELAYSTSKTGATLATALANRGLEGGSAQAHAINATVKGILTAGMWNDLVDSLCNILVKATGAIDTTKLLAAVSSASDTAAGKVELATTAETTTGTDATRAVTPDGLHDMTSLAGAAWFLDEDTMSSDSATKVPSQQSVKAYVDATAGSTDGWTAAGETWTYASASTFTIAGVDKTTKYTKGTRLKFTQTSAKYAVVVSSSFSTDTTVTIAVNTDYTIANAAITSPYYSYEVNPQGYPHWFAFASTWAGFSADPTGTFTYNIVGRICTMLYADASAGTSNATTMTFTGPVAAADTSTQAAIVFVKDNGTNQTTPGHLSTTATSATISVYKTWAQGAFTNSGNKDIYTGMFSYKF